MVSLRHIPPTSPCFLPVSDCYLVSSSHTIHSLSPSVLNNIAMYTSPWFLVLFYLVHFLLTVVIFFLKQIWLLSSYLNVFIHHPTALGIIQICDLAPASLHVYIYHSPVLIYHFWASKQKRQRLAVWELVCSVCLESTLHLPGPCSSLSSQLDKNCLGPVPKRPRTGHVLHIPSTLCSPVMSLTALVTLNHKYTSFF